MINVTFRALLVRYFGARRYLVATAAALGVSRSTVVGWIYRGHPVAAHYYARLAALKPQQLRRRQRWAERQISNINKWLASQPAELDSICLEFESLRIRALRYGKSTRVED